MNNIKRNSLFHVMPKRCFMNKNSFHNKMGCDKFNLIFGKKQIPFSQEIKFKFHNQKEHNKISKSEEIKEMRKKKPFFMTWKCFTINLFLAFPIFYLYVLEDQKKKKKISKTTVDSIGKPLIGGDFTLINQKGEFITNKSFKNKFCLIYFGFTYCPDICPQELEKQTIVVEKLKEKYGNVIVPVFISVDPKRDTVAQINHYCKLFSPHLIGLTGTPELIKNVAKNFRVYFNENITNEVKKSGDEANQYNYLIDHSIIHYLLNTKGEFVDFFGKNCTASEMVEKIGEYLNEHLKNENEQKLTTANPV